MDKSDIDELFLQREPSSPADHTRRELYTMPKDGKECENCANFGKRHCWARKSDGSGSWDRSGSWGGTAAEAGVGTAAEAGVGIIINPNLSE